MAAQVAITGLILTPMQLDFVVPSIVLLLESVQARRSAARGNHRAPQEVPNSVSAGAPAFEDSVDTPPL
jgi:hypothetical protein